MADVRPNPDIQLSGFAGYTAPAPVTDGSRVSARFSRFGDLFTSLVDPDYNTMLDIDMFGGLESSSRQTMIGGQWGDIGPWPPVYALFTTGSGSGTPTAGEYQIATGTTSASTAMVNTASATTGEVFRLTSGAEYTFGCISRFADTGTANNVRRIGMFTVSGTTPQDGYAFELNGTTFQIATYKAGVATTVASGSFSRNSTAPFTIDTNYHRYEITFHHSDIAFSIDGVVRHILSGIGISTPRTAATNLPINVSNINGAITTNVVMAVLCAWLTRKGSIRYTDIPYFPINKVVQYTTTQTSAVVLAPTSGRRLVITSAQIQVGGTTAGTMQLYFGSGSYGRGTSNTIFDGEWAPSATSKPGIILVSPPHGWKGLINDSLRVTTSAAINPLTVNVWGYEE
jgi:hypothetical protein